MRPKTWEEILPGQAVVVQGVGEATVLSVSAEGSCEVAVADQPPLQVSNLKMVRFPEEDRVSTLKPNPGEFGIMELHRKTVALDKVGVSVLTLRRYVFGSDRPAIPCRIVAEGQRKRAFFTAAAVDAAMALKTKNFMKWGPLDKRPVAAGAA